MPFARATIQLLLQEVTIDFILSPIFNDKVVVSFRKEELETFVVPVNMPLYQSTCCCTSQHAVVPVNMPLYQSTCCCTGQYAVVPVNM